MFALIETIIGFCVIMLLLSLLVKSLTSVVKSHFDYYSRNLQTEVERLLRGTIGGEWNTWAKKISGFQDIQWRRLGEEYLTKENMEWLLIKLGAKREALKNLEARLEVHKANVRYAFEKRTKNISLALGMALCLFLNINAFSIWNTLYNDQQIRAKLSSQNYAEAAMKMAEQYNKEIKQLESNQSNIDAEKHKEELTKKREELFEQFYHFKKEVDFGIGNIWKKPLDKWPTFLFEFFGSLLTGILVSIGAPYWHDLLRALSSFRQARKV